MTTSRLTLATLLLLSSACRLDIVAASEDRTAALDESLNQAPSASVEVPPPNVVTEEPEDTAVEDTGFEDTGFGSVEPAEEGPVFTCAILSPADQATFPSGTSLTFDAEFTYAGNGDVLNIWSSDPFGTMALGSPVNFILPDGAHQVTYTVRDGSGNTCTDSIFIVMGG